MFLSNSSIAILCVRAFSTYIKYLALELFSCFYIETLLKMYRNAICDLL